MSIPFHIIIPARLGSTRFPGKLLQQLAGQTIIECTYRQALLAKATTVTVATDSRSILEVVQGFGGHAVMTQTTHPSGSDRLAEAVRILGLQADDIVVNVQGDEPLIDPQLIHQVAHTLSTTSAPMATLCYPLQTLAQLHNPDVVKVVRDQQQHALYFSRSAIPYHRDAVTSLAHVYRHIGLYAYRAAFLLDYVQMPVCALETIEALEQLRILWAGYRIKVAEACVPPLQDINTPEDLARARLIVTE
jgi:3-deoxy-manno-octulosonate cytidylyltransferase (CMP-KDO synthetase)